MSRLDTLPVELLMKIMSHISKTNGKELSALCCASRWLRVVVEPHLYRYLKFEYNISRPNINKQVPVHLLLRSLLSRPRLFTLIERLDLCCIEQPILSEQNTCIFLKSFSEPNLSGNSMKLAEDLVQSLNPPSKGRWIQGLHDGSFKYSTALLVSQLVNLKKLHLNAFFCRLDSFVPLIFGHSDIASMRRRFPILADVEKDMYSFNQEMFLFTRPEDFLPFFYLPSIRSLSSEIPCQCISMWKPTTAVPTLTSLVTERFLKSIKNLKWILSQTPNLRCLAFHRNSGAGRPKIYDFAQLGKSLEPVGHCLESLVISIRHVCFRWREIEYRAFRFKGRIDSLKHFKKFFELNVPAITLLGPDLHDQSNLSETLPSTLRHLRLSDDMLIMSPSLNWEYEEFFESVRKYLTDKESHAPKLEKLSLRLAEYADEELTEQARVKEICEKVGVVLQFSQYPCPSILSALGVAGPV